MSSAAPRRAAKRARSRVAELTRHETWALALLVLGSVAVLPGALNRFVFPKLAVTAAGVALAVRCPVRGRLPRLITGLLAAAVAVLAVAALAGADPLGQVIGVAPRYEGLLTIGLYVGAGVTGARLLGPDRPADTDRLLVRLLSGAAIAVALLALLEAVGLSPLESDVSRPGSLLGNASDQGAWAVLVLGPLLLVAVRDRSRQAVGGAVAAALAVVLSGSRGALLGAALVLVVLLLTLPGRRRRIALAGVVGGMALLTLLLPAVRGRVLGEGLAAATAAGRGQLWRESWKLFLERPLLGVGPGGFGEALRGVHGPGWYAALGPDHQPDSPHAWPVQALLAGGPLLLGLAVVLAGLTVRATWSRVAAHRLSLSGGLAAGLAGYSVALLFHFTGAGHTPLAALFAGALLAAPGGRETAGPLVDRIVAVAAGAFAAVAVLGAVAEIPLREAVVRLADGDAAGADEYFGTAQVFRWWDPAVAAMAGHAFTVAGTTAGDPDMLDRAARRLAGAATSSELLDLGRVREAEGDLDGAADALDAALDRDPAQPEALLVRGIVAARGQQWDDAERFLLSAAAAAPDSPAPWENLARVRAASGDRSGAEEAARTAADLRN